MFTEQKRETLITIVGASQSGKTTLAAGLAKTSCDDFNVGFADNATRDYLQPRIAGISAGHWTEATSGEDRDICLNVNTPGGCSALISFKEYMGERIRDATYLEQIVGKPNGALILLSPGMESLRDPMQREELIGNLKGIIDHLKVNKCVAIAFVVTACDRLKTDLKEFAPSFENYAGEVTNYLNTSGMHWKRFDVTITGELQDQDKPSIAYGKDNTSRDPFVWIMDRVVGKKRISMAKRFLGRTAAVVAAALLLGIGIGSWQWWSEGAKLHTCEKAVAEVEKQISDAISRSKPAALKMATDNLQGLITSNANLVCRWESHAKTREENAKKWSRLYDKKCAEYFLMAMNSRYEQRMTQEGTEDNCKVFDGELARFKPVDATLKNPLTRQWNELRPKIREAYDVNHGNELEAELAEYKTRKKEQKLLDDLLTFKKKVSNWETTFKASAKIKVEVLSAIANLEHEIYVEVDTQNGSSIRDAIDSMNDNAATNATPDALESLGRRIAQWTPHTDDGKQQKTTLSTAFESQQSNWKRAFSDRLCTEEADRVVQKIHALKPDDQSLEADTVRVTLKTAYGFSGQCSHATPEILCAATNKIDEACETFLEKFLDSFVHKWKPTDRKKPEICKQDEDYITGALDVVNPVKPDEELSVGFLKKLEDKRAEAENAWRIEKKRICDEFIKQVLGTPAVELYEKYRNWYERNADNPSVKDVDSIVEAVVGDFFKLYIDEVKTTFLQDGSAFNSEAGRKEASARFDEFQKLCLALAKDSCGLADSWCVKFARECKNRGKIDLGMNKAFGIGMTVTRVDVNVSEDRAWNDYIGAKFDVTYLNYTITGQELENEQFLRIEDSGEYVAKNAKNSWQTIWNGTKRLSLNPWTCAAFGLNASLDVDWTVVDGKGFGFLRVYPLHEDYKRGYFERCFKCFYVVKEHSYTCYVRFYCAFDGVDIFELFNQYCK